MPSFGLVKLLRELFFLTLDEKRSAVFRKVELNEDYVQDLRKERLRKSRRALTGSSSDGLLIKGISPKDNGEAMPDSDGLDKGTRSVAGGVVRSDGSLMRDSRTATSTTPAVSRSYSISPKRESPAGHRRSDSMDSMRSQVRVRETNEVLRLIVSSSDSVRWTNCRQRRRNGVLGRFLPATGHRSGRR